jgi:CRP-like cAMP-binding protein
MDLRNLFRNAGDVRDYPAGSVIFTEGSPGDMMFVVLEGEVEVQAGGRVVETILAGDVLGELALIDSRPRSATATAKTACRLAPVDERRFLFLVQETPFFALHLMRVLAARLRNMNALVQG